MDPLGLVNELCSNLYLEREMKDANHVKYVSLVKGNVYKQNSSKCRENRNSTGTFLEIQMCISSESKLWMLGQLLKNTTEAYQRPLNENTVWLVHIQNKTSNESVNR